MATSYLSPGVYIEEVDRGSKPIEAVGTSTVGFLGTCSKGPVNKAIFCCNWTQFTNTFGDFRDSQFLAHAIYGFFNNGGTRCFITNIGEHPGGADRVAADAPAAAKGRSQRDVLEGGRHVLGSLAEQDEVLLLHQVALRLQQLEPVAALLLHLLHVVELRFELGGRECAPRT